MLGHLHGGPNFWRLSVLLPRATQCNIISNLHFPLGFTRRTHCNFKNKERKGRKEGRPNQGLLVSVGPFSFLFHRGTESDSIGILQKNILCHIEHPLQHSKPKKKGKEGGKTKHILPFSSSRARHFPFPFFSFHPFEPTNRNSVEFILFANSL